MATATMRKVARKTYPPPPQKFKDITEVGEYLTKLYRALSEARNDSYGGKILHSTVAPTAQDGRDGDIWVEHRE